MTAALSSIDDVIARLRAIDSELPPADGAAVFNRMYLTVTEQVASALTAHQVFEDQAFMADLDVTFASLWLEAYDAPASHWPAAWAPLFESRHSSAVLPVQFAIAGMNSHIAHDLPVAVTRTCTARGLSLDSASVHADYLAVNGLLATCEENIRRSFLSDAGKAVDNQLEPVAHLISSWDINRARDAAWTRARILWTLRRIGPLADDYAQSLAHTVGFASRMLLTPVALA